MTEEEALEILSLPWREWPWPDGSQGKCMECPCCPVCIMCGHGAYSFVKRQGKEYSVTTYKHIHCKWWEAAKVFGFASEHDEGVLSE